MRNGVIELARFAGSLAILWFHLGLPGREIALGALPMFVTFLVYFGAGQPIELRARRLLVPWVFWSVVYGALKFLDGDSFAPWMLLTGPAIHLWFLPFAFVVERLGVLLLPLSFLFLLLVEFPVPVVQWASVLPAAALGYGLAKGASRYWCLALAAAGGVLHLLGFQGAVSLMTGALVVFLALSISIQSRTAEYLGRIAFGVYLVHPIIVAVLLRVADLDPVPMFVIAALGSVLAAELCRRAVPWAA